MATTAPPVTSTAVAPDTPATARTIRPPKAPIPRTHAAALTAPPSGRGPSPRRPHDRTRPTAPPSRPHPPVPALAALVLGDGLEEVLAPEVGPQDVGEHELRVGQLPQEEVRDAVLARRAHHE